MRRKTLQRLTAIAIVLSLSLLISMKVQAARKKTTASSKETFREGNVKDANDVFGQNESESKEYRAKMISQSEESIRLLREIRDLLELLNQKK